MNRKERIFHAMLFEAGALVLIASGTWLFTDESPFKIGGIGLVLSMIAMTWNYVFNAIFDRAVPGDRLARSKATRAVHALLFEAGMLSATVPVLMYFLEMTALEVLGLSVGSAVFFVAYAFVYNYAYDYVRDAVISGRRCGPVAG